MDVMLYFDTSCGFEVGNEQFHIGLFFCFVDIIKLNGPFQLWQLVRLNMDLSP